jgi:hypothetical protein
MEHCEVAVLGITHLIYAFQNIENYIIMYVAVLRDKQNWTAKKS